MFTDSLLYIYNSTFAEGGKYGGNDFRAAEEKRS